MLDQIVRQGIQQAFAAGWITCAQCVDRLDQTNPHVVGPYSICNRTAKVTIILAGKPISQDLTSILLALDIDWCGIEGCRELRLTA